MIECAACGGKGYHWHAYDFEADRETECTEETWKLLPRNGRGGHCQAHALHQGRKGRPARCAMVRAKWNMNPITMIMTKIKPIINPDEYYQRSEVSNSDLTELKNQLHPHAVWRP